MLEKVNMIIMIILSITICVSITVQAEEIGSMQASDQDVWTGIVLPKKYRLEYENIGNFLLDAERCSEEVQKSLLKHTAWKPGVQLFRTTGLSRYDLLGRLGEKIVPITRESIGYFVEKIDSEAKAIELVIFFHEGILLRQEADVQALIQACRTSNVAKVNNTMPKSFEPTCRHDPENGVYRISLLMYEHRNVFETKCLVTFNGIVGCIFKNYVVGPQTISGWDEPSDQFHRYVKKVASFEESIAKPLESIVLKLLKDATLNNNGLMKARENGLVWLLQSPNVKLYSTHIRNFLNAEGKVMNQELRMKALAKLQ